MPVAPERFDMATDATTERSDGSERSGGDGHGQAGDDGGVRDRPVEDLPLPPRADEWPLVGQTFAIATDPFEAYERNLAPVGDVVRYTFAGRRWVTVMHPDQVQQVLLDEWDRFGKYSFEDFGGEFAEEGLLFAEGEQWRRQRAALQDAFTMDQLQSYADAMTTYADEMVAGWRDGEVVAVNEAFADLTLRILTHSLFDLDLEGRSEVVGEFTRMTNQLASPSGLSDYLPLWVPTPSNRAYKRKLSAFRTFVADLIDERRGDEAASDDFLSLMLTAEDDDGNTMSETEVRDQLVTFLFAGHETTSLALTFTLLELAQRPDVRERLHAEFDEVLGEADPTPSTMLQLDYTEQVIEEALRLYPPAYVLYRRTNEDVAVGGYRVPEGTRMTVPQFHVHRDGRWYDDPEQFRPDRWTDGFEDELHDYAYFPFGGGPRHCIGMRFAMMELKLVLPTLLRRVEPELVSDPDPELAPGATLHPADDVEVRMHER
jgi:cytochrome P450